VAGEWGGIGDGSALKLTSYPQERQSRKKAKKERIGTSTSSSARVSFPYSAG